LRAYRVWCVANEAELFINGGLNVQEVAAVSLTLILPRSRTGTVWFYTSTSKKRASSTTKTVHKVINKGLKTYV